MQFKMLDSGSKREVASLFSSVFTSSEGVDEGKLVGKLAEALAARIDNLEVLGMGAYADEALIGAIFFTRLRFKESVIAYMLSPVAVSTAHQGNGIGQALIRYGLNELKNRSATLALTYGDPAFYSKTGFQSLSENVIQAPQALSMPQGWMGLPLLVDVMPNLKSRPICVPEFNDPAYW